MRTGVDFFLRLPVMELVETAKEVAEILNGRRK
jgi:hypothetical protein